MMRPDRDVVVVRQMRGGYVDCEHRVHVALSDATGRVVAAWGDVARPVLPRSTAKPFQAVPLAMVAGSDVRVSDEELALACASHHGQPRHLAILERWIKRLGLREDALRCGFQSPFCRSERARLAAASEHPGVLHNNNAGKHLGFLTVCLARGYPMAGYTQPDHPVQGEIAGALATACGDPAGNSPAVENCGMPTKPVALRALAKGYAGLACPRDGTPQQAIVRAVLAAPELGSSSTALASRLMREADRRCIVKSGADGIYGVTLVDDGLGLALKVEDGSGSAADIVLIHLLAKLGIIDEATVLNLRPYGETIIRNLSGTQIGEAIVVNSD